MFKFGLSTLVIVSLAMASCSSDPAAKAPQNTARADSLTANTPVPNLWKDKVCDLITDQEFYTLFNVDEKRDFANKRSLVTNGGFCLRTWKKPDWREREIREQQNPNVVANPESALAVEVLDYSTPATCAAQYEMAKNNKANGYSTQVPGLGEGALWSETASMLLVKKGTVCLQIKLDHADVANDNLPLAKEVAILALKKL